MRIAHSSLRRRRRRLFFKNTASNNTCKDRQTARPTERQKNKTNNRLKYGSLRGPLLHSERERERERCCDTRFTAAARSSVPVGFCCCFLLVLELEVFATEACLSSARDFLRVGFLSSSSSSSSSSAVSLSFRDQMLLLLFVMALSRSSCWEMRVLLS
jgi:hypothetical protein